MDSTAPVFDPDISARYLRRSAAAAKDKTLIAFGAGEVDLDKGASGGDETPGPSAPGAEASTTVTF